MLLIHVYTIQPSLFLEKGFYFVPVSISLYPTIILYYKVVALDEGKAFNEQQM